MWRGYLVFGFAFFLVHTRERRIAAGLLEVQAFLAQHPQALPEKAFVVGPAFDVGLVWPKLSCY
ncbi:hypothetical protein A244_38350 [Pseudomonas syringae pv. actinidiae ICMP 18807]|uniref:Uncharacterized protein n=1 Tax=Pseudomonas syringae pv. actinidiae ICMP 18807 TaxID=1194404 RepID=S6SJA6_PSESF|nr:hypothetical protein A244_38350 [Pseudomonas syringae pv. actinidiae ICMP 18807]